VDVGRLQRKNKISMLENHPRFGKKGPYSRNAPVAAQKLRVREVEAGEDGGGAERRACLAATVVAMADIEGQRAGERRSESDGAALAGGFHDGGFFYGEVGWS
jgi:hypothetical protein